MLKPWREEKEVWKQTHPPPLSEADEAEYHRRFSSSIDQWLDAGHGECLLADSSFREVVTESIRHFNGDRYELVSWVIMPNHVHLCLVLNPDWSLEKVVFTWKRRSSGEVNRMRGKSGPFWMRDYFDRLIRDRDHSENVVRYIRRNPGKAGLRTGQYELWESELGMRVA